MKCYLLCFDWDGNALLKDKVSGQVSNFFKLYGYFKVKNWRFFSFQLVRNE